MDSKNTGQKKKDSPPRKDPPTRHTPDEAEKESSSSSSRSTTQAAKERRLSDQSSVDNSAKQQARAAALRASSSGMYRKPTSSLDAQAKARGRRPKSAAIRPKRVVSNATKLQRLQEEVVAKERGRKPMGTTSEHSNSSLSSSLSAVKQLNRMEADIAAKDRARASRGSGAKRASTSNKSTATTSKPSTSRLDRMEAEIAAKAKVGRASAALKNSKSNASKNDRLAMKLQKAGVATTATIPGAVSSNEDSKKEKKDSDGPFSYAGASSEKKKTGSSPSKNYRKDSNNDPTDIALSKDDVIDEEKGNKKLAVAVAVQEDDDVYIPSAVEYDPDAKLPMLKNQRVRVYSILTCIVLIVISACSLTVLTVLEKNSIEANRVPTQAPTCLRCTSDFVEYIELEVGTQKLSDPTSPEYKAKEWIIHEDPLQLVPTDKNFIQRYLLAAFYFDTHQQGEWRSCNRMDSSKNETESCMLKKVTVIKPLTFNEFEATRWLSSEHECFWAGIVCDDSNQTRRLDLHGQGISGTLPSSFARFPYVQTLSLQLNNFSGTLPSEYGKLKHMIHIELHNNKLTGTFPASWSNIRNLQQLNLAQNQLTGQLPTAIGKFRTIKGLFLYKNKFSGTLPPEMANANSLSYVRLHKNQFTGGIPDEFGDMQLTELWLHENLDLGGTLPQGLYKLSNSLADLRVARTGIGGTLPEYLYDMAQLWRLDAYENQLSGTISSNITKLGGLQTLRLHNNQLSGTIPPEMGSMTSLTDLFLEGNPLTGEVPASVCALTEDRLEMFTADCLNTTLDPGEVVCDCCNVCCDANGICDYF